MSMQDQVDKIEQRTHEMHGMLSQFVGTVQGHMDNKEIHHTPPCRTLDKLFWYLLTGSVAIAVYLVSQELK